jgi:uncharacterized BrkB/YihY/UPF0761 family membrane protein
MLWLYFCMNIFFLGAELNSWIQQNAKKRKASASETVSIAPPTENTSVLPPQQQHSEIPPLPPSV